MSVNRTLQVPATGSFSTPAGRWWPGDNLQRNLALANALEPVAARHGVPVAAAAVAWTLSWPGVTGAIVGARTTEQVDGWLPAASVQLTGQDIQELADAVRRTGAGEGPAAPGRAD